MFKFYLNGTLINDTPDKWDAIDTSIKRDDISGILLYDSNLRFTTYGGQDLYIALKAKWDTDRFGESTFDVYQRAGSAGYLLIHAGTIFHSDLEFNLINGSINFKTEDRGFYAMVNNNKNIEVNLDQNLSKNEVNIGGCPSFLLEVHKVSNGTYYAAKRQAFKVYDVLEYLIRFMSDDRMGFQSETFGAGGQYEGYCIVAGHEMIDHDQTVSPRLSWYKLANDLIKRFNVRFAITGSAVSPVVQCESFDRFYSGDLSYTLSDIPQEIRLKVDTNLIYSGVNVGSTDYETTSSLTYPDVQYLITFKEENLYFKGTNNIDRTLDLIGNLVISNSSIEVVLEMLSGHDTYDEKQFLIHYNTATNKSISTNWTPISGKHLYNETLNNINILSRWSGAFPSEIVSNFYDPGPDRFKALKYRQSPDIFAFTDKSLHDIGTFESLPINYSDDYANGYDPGLNYGDTTPQGTDVPQTASYYTAPTGALYSFSASASIRLNKYTTGTTLIGKRKLYFKLRFYKSTTETFDSASYEVSRDDGYNSTKYFTLSNSISTYLNAGDTMEVRLVIDIESANNYSNKRNIELAVDPGSFFSCNGIDIGGGTLTVSNPNEYKCVKMNFTYPLTLEDYLSIRSSKEGLIKVPITSNTAINGWVENLKFDHSSGEATFELISDGNTIYR